MADLLGNLNCWISHVKAHMFSSYIPVMEVSMMKVHKEEKKSVKLPAKIHEISVWEHSTDSLSLPLDSFTSSLMTGTCYLKFCQYSPIVTAVKMTFSV